ncbi:HlyC/CorC family transporter, partial [Candidatus Woesearchaeota archaeon]|nr:HlyC/CorC family transporter [Candidatus Woesearchaeota archaeon]
VLEFDDTNVDEIMTPRLDTYCLEMHKTVTEVLDEVLEKGFSRIPIYSRKMDNMKGVVLVNEMLRAVHAKQGKKTLKALMQDVLVVPETRKIDSLLREFQKSKSPFAIVVDEHGLFIGVVTIEDVLEELVGEIYDERDKQEPEVKKLDKGVFLVPGRMTIDDLNERYGFKLPEDEDYDTLAGYLLDLVGKLPKENKEYKDKYHIFVVEKVRQNRIESVKVTRKNGKK